MCLRKVLGHDPERHWVDHNRRGTGCALNARVEPSLDSEPEPFGDNDLSAHGFYNARAVTVLARGARAIAARVGAVFQFGMPLYPPGFVEALPTDSKPHRADRVAMGLRDQARRLPIHLPPGRRAGTGVLAERPRLDRPGAADRRWSCSTAVNRVG